MNVNDILIALGSIDDDLILRSEKMHKGITAKRMRLYITSAACLFLAIVSVFAAIGFSEPESIYGPTSEKYDNLSQLLEYLGEQHEDHIGTESLGGVITEGDGVSPFSYTTARHSIYKEWIYYVNLGDVYVRNMESNDKPRIAAYGGEHYGIDEAKGLGHIYYLQIWEDKLIAYFEGGKNESIGWSIAFRIYQIKKDGSLKLLNQYEQRGSDSGSYIYNGELYILTTDGQCACGYSRLDDVSDYYPLIAVNGKKRKWKDKDISILGEPSSIRYLALTKIDIKTGKITDQQAFYGNGTSAHYGPGWLVIEPGYTFNTEKNIIYNGSFSLKEIASAHGEEDISIDYIIDIELKDDVYRIIGVSYGKGIFFAAADIDNRQSGFAFIAINDDSVSTYWKGDKVDIMYEAENDISKSVTAFFDGTKVTYVPSDFYVQGDYIFLFNGFAVWSVGQRGEFNVIDTASSELQWLCEKPVRLPRNGSINSVTSYVDNLFIIGEKVKGEEGNIHYRHLYMIDPKSDTPIKCLYECIEECTKGKDCGRFAWSLIKYNGEYYFLCRTCGDIKLIETK